MEYTETSTENPLPEVSIRNATLLDTESSVQARNSFIEANTISSSLIDIKQNHIIPVYIKDNETLISHADFIETTIEVVKDSFSNEDVLEPIVRVSHPMKGRVPEARNKPAFDLLEHEKTLYYERMAFIIEIPSFQGVIDGNVLSLTIGGVKSYSLDNLYNKKGADEHFKIFIGFKNTICTNMCVWSDGFIGDLKVTSLGQLKGCIRTLIDNYNSTYHLHCMEQLTRFGLTEQQFATVIGKCRMYQHLSLEQKREIPALLLGDTQIGTVCKDFYRDKSFCRDANGNINLWKLYNLLTGANKSSYIDSFLDRSVNAFHLVEQIRMGLEMNTDCWYLK